MAQLSFAKKKSNRSDGASGRLKTWKVIISDDEQEIHDITRLALDGFNFCEAKLEFLSAHSGEETRALIKRNPDTAVILQDVVMETDSAGLDVVRYIREELKNTFVRIVLRTGQPGQAPERDVIVNYDINDYKEKTELTSQKLFTLMHTSLRSYRDIVAIEKNKNGLQKIIDATAEIFTQRSIERFTSATLDQLTALLYQERNAVYCEINRLAAKKEPSSIKIVSASGSYEPLIGQNAREVLDESIVTLLDKALNEKQNQFIDNVCVAYFSNSEHDERLLYLTGVGELSQLDKELVDIFIKNVSISFDNLTLYRNIEEAQLDVINCLGQAIEAQSTETNNHIRRVSEYAKLLAIKTGCTHSEAQLIKLASPLHDIGKCNVPENILNKPGSLTDDEWSKMKEHSNLGYQLLSHSNREVLNIGAIMAKQHHERWDGSGYPQGLIGEQIHRYARILAIADSFDRLGTNRVYKTAWNNDQIKTHFMEQKGKQFDPEMVELLLANFDDFLEIKQKF